MPPKLDLKKEDQITIAIVVPIVTLTLLTIAITICLRRRNRKLKKEAKEAKRKLSDLEQQDIIYARYKNSYESDYNDPIDREVLESIERQRRPSEVDGTPARQELGYATRSHNELPLMLQPGRNSTAPYEGPVVTNTPKAELEDTGRRQLEDTDLSPITIPNALIPRKSIPTTAQGSVSTPQRNDGNSSSSSPPERNDSDRTSTTTTTNSSTLVSSPVSPCETKRSVRFSTPISSAISPPPAVIISPSTPPDTPPEEEETETNPTTPLVNDSPERNEHETTTSTPLVVTDSAKHNEQVRQKYLEEMTQERRKLDDKIAALQKEADTL